MMPFMYRCIKNPFKEAETHYKVSTAMAREGCGRGEVGMDRKIHG